MNKPLTRRFPVRGSPMEEDYAPPHRALLLYFSGSHLKTAILNLYDAMEQMGWDVLIRDLDSQDSKQAQTDLQEAVDTLIQGIDGHNQSLVVFYAGYGLQTAKEKGQMVPVPGQPWYNWSWHAGPAEGAVCKEHVVTVDPEPMFRQLDQKVANDVLFILNTPAEISQTYFRLWCKHPKPLRNVQILLFRENWSMPINTAKLGSCTASSMDKICRNEVLQTPSGFVDVPVQKMSEALADLSRRLEDEGEYSLFKAYQRVRMMGRREAEIWPILGMPQKHPLIRGHDLEFVREMDE